VVAYRILQEKETSPRVKVLNFFINVALECQRIQNFNGMMEIVSALNSSAIHRLKASTRFFLSLNFLLNDDAHILLPNIAKTANV